MSVAVRNWVHELCRRLRHLPPYNLWYYDQQTIEGHVVIMVAHAQWVKGLEDTLPSLQEGLRRNNPHLDAYKVRQGAKLIIFTDAEPYWHQSFQRGAGFAGASIAEFRLFAGVFWMQRINMVIPPPGQLSYQGQRLGHRYSEDFHYVIEAAQNV